MRRDEHTRLHCQRCGATWGQRGEQPPIKCPRCGSQQWAQPKVLSELFRCSECGKRHSDLLTCDQASQTQNALP